MTPISVCLGSSIVFTSNKILIHSANFAQHSHIIQTDTRHQYWIISHNRLYYACSAFDSVEKLPNLLLMNICIAVVGYGCSCIWKTMLTSKNVLFQSLDITVMTTLPVAGSRSISQRIVQHRALPLSQSCIYHA